MRRQYLVFVILFLQNTCVYNDTQRHTKNVIVTRLPITIPTTAASDIVIPDKSTKQAFNYATISVHVRMHKYDGYKEMFSLSDIYLS